ncbi:MULTISPECIES: hypothetical protein [Streptomycetaceae]|uniref:hypothetical protein n=1 Tax=Streptomycetaceae TaxID=2062 RepID=UPI00288C0F04|nr:hypothetical protein [Streptomyces sp. ITFR-21]WNI20172.1 hypothetical protein RLT57_32045 [Streptomyces sp. ITFR-21]
MTATVHQTDESDEFTEIRVRVAFSELVTYQVDRDFEIPVEIAHSPRAIRQYLADELDPDDLADDCLYENTTSCEDRSVHEVHVLQTTADHWRSDGVRQIAINRYMRSVRGPMTVWLAPDRKRPTGRCSHCGHLTLLRIGALAALHRVPPAIEPCPGAGHLVAHRDSAQPPAPASTS